MKYLCLACVIGWSAAAHAVTGTGPAVDVPITISGVCNNPAVPHPAQAVGFTTLAYCADFTQQTTTNNVLNGIPGIENWTGMSWLDCTGAGTRVGPIAGKQWVLFSLGYPIPPCSAITVGLDSLSGVNALQLTAIPSYGDVIVEMTTGINSCSTSTNPCYEVFPTTNLYAEIHWRLGTTNLSNITSPGNSLADWWSWYANTTTNAGCLEVDFIEYFGTVAVGPGYAVGCKPTIGGGTISSAGNADANYHTVASLASSNSTNFMTNCVYQDGAAVMTGNQCTTASGGSTTPYTQQGYIAVMNEADWPTALSSGSYAVYVAWIRIWSCAGWNTTGNPQTTSNTCSVASPPTTPP